MALSTVAFVLAAALALVQFTSIEVPLPGRPWASVASIPSDWFSGGVKELKGPFAPNTRLRNATVLFKGKVLNAETVLPSPDGTEFVTMDRHGSITTATWDGKTYVQQAPERRRIPASSVARPMGFRRDLDGNLVAAAMGAGLVKLEKAPTPGGGLLDKVVVLASHVTDGSPVDPGSPIVFANDLDVSPSTGVVYFTDSGAVPPPHSWDGPGHEPFVDAVKGFLGTFCHARPTGRLLAYFPSNGSVHVLAKHIWYANGAALSQDESFVAITETPRLRVLRYWLQGDKAGTLDVLIDGLPGMPDGIDRAPDGGFWVALPSPHTPLFNVLTNKIVRSLTPWLPFTPPMPPWGAVVKVSPTGEVLEFLMDPEGKHVPFITAVKEAASPAPGAKARLFMGSVPASERWVAYLDI